MKQLALILLVAITGGIIGGTAVWLSVKSEPIAPLVIDVRENEREPATLTMDTPARRARSSSIAQATSIATTHLTLPGPEPVRPESTSAGDRTPSSSAELQEGHSSGFSNDRVVVSQVALTAPRSASPASRHAQREVADDESVDGALSFALEAAEPYVKEGFTVREDHWAGKTLGKDGKTIVHQLFKGNEYWFWIGAARQDSKISVHVFDLEGRNVDAEHWQDAHMAAARVVPEKTSSYYLVVGSDRVPAPTGTESLLWAMAYGFR